MNREGFAALEPVNPLGVSGDGASPFGVRHQLCHHPLLSVDAIAECALELQAVARKAGRLSRDKPVEHHLGNLPPVMPGGRPPRIKGVDVAEMIRTLEANRCWVVLWNIEAIPRYAELLDACVTDARQVATPGRREVLREGFIFISAPDTVTPVHIDPEHNVLLQVSGEKTTTVGRLTDHTLWHREIERVLLGGDRHLPIPAEEEQPFHLTPGLGVYVPPFAPHWVRNGSTTCISLSVTWRTEEAYRAELVHTANGRLRCLGLHPAPPGTSRLRDEAKIAALGAARRTMNSGRKLIRIAAGYRITTR